MIDKKADIEQRIKDAWWDVELFRVTKGRLPNKEDRLTKKDAKEFIDRFVFGSETTKTGLSFKISDDLSKFAFHVYASTNLAYEKE